jgi:hypothetical protein
MREVEVARSDWHEYFAALSAQDAGAPATVQVLPGEPPAQRWLGWALHACRYDSGGDLLELALRGDGDERSVLRCFVAEPREVIARESQLEREILVRDAAGVQTVLRLRRGSPRSHRPATESSWASDTTVLGRVPIRRPAGERPGRMAGTRWS